MSKFRITEQDMLCMQMMQRTLAHKALPAKLHLCNAWVDATLVSSKLSDRSAIPVRTRNYRVRLYKVAEPVMLTVYAQKYPLQFGWQNLICVVHTPDGVGILFAAHFKLDNDGQLIIHQFGLNSHPL